MSRWCRLGDGASVSSVARFLPIKLAFLGTWVARGGGGGLRRGVDAGNKEGVEVGAGLEVDGWVRRGAGTVWGEADRESDVLLAKMLSSVAAI